MDKHIGALWANTSKKGEVFYSGEIEIDGKKTKIVVFKNNQKTTKHPNFKIYVSKPKEPAPEKEPPLFSDNPEDDKIPF